MPNQSLKLILLLSFSALVMGCASPIVLVGEQREAIDIEQVGIFYAQRPACEFETIGYLRIEGGYYSLAGLLGRMRQQAADIGAEGVYVLETRRLDVSEYIGTAKAIRCLTD